jgi:iron complex transport system ATP-binding protein
MTELAVQNLAISKAGKRLVKGVSFAVRQGELVVMLGPNGAGKSLTLHHAIGLGQPDDGRAMLDGAPVRTLKPDVRARALSYLPQMRPLAWPVQVSDLVALGRFAHGARAGRPGSVDAAAVASAMDACSVTELAGRNANTLSGGELARAHCARAFASEAPLLIADEPVAALDPREQFRIMDLFRAYVTKGGGALVVLHDIRLAARYADRLIWMKDGEIVADGAVEVTLTAARLAEVYGVRTEVSGRDVRVVGVV